jgi:hypothetical protein
MVTLTLRVAVAVLFFIVTPPVLFGLHSSEPSADLDHHPDPITNLRLDHVSFHPNPSLVNNLTVGFWLHSNLATPKPRTAKHTYTYPKIFEISLISTGPLSDALVVEASAKEEEDRWKISSGSLAAC